MTDQPSQPELMSDFGCRFYGRAQTVTGDIWWYEQNGKRYPLRPVLVRALEQKP